MILEIKKLICERKRISLGDLAIHFDVEPETLEPILEQLVRSGIVRVCGGSDENGNACGPCSGCSIGQECMLSGKVYEYTPLDVEPR